jgi:hypothetical protein
VKAPQRQQADERMIRAAERATYALRQLETQFVALADDLIMAGEAWTDLKAAVAPGADARPALHALHALVERVAAVEATFEVGHTQWQASLAQLRHDLVAARGPYLAGQDPPKE